VSDADLREALLGTWRLISFQGAADGPFANPLGEEPLRYLVYTPENHMFAQLATRGTRTWSGPEAVNLPPPQPRNTWQRIQ
jgi:hypothetical protein